VTATKLDEKPLVIQLAIDGEGRIFWNGEAIARSELDQRFVEAAARQPELHLRADRAVRYEKVADVMAAAQRANIVKIAFLTQPAQ
jgi:biopolymer transport protein ExbD